MANQRLLMYRGYAIQSTQPTSITALNGLTAARQLAANVTTCQINYVAGALQRGGIVTIYFGLTQGQSKVSLVHQINVVNSP